MADVQRWQRPPFEPGNTLSTTHGARSPRVLDPAVDELIAVTFQANDLPEYLRAPEFLPAVRAWARAEVRAALVGDYVDRMDVAAQLRPLRGGAMPPIEQVRRLEESAAKHRQRLGLDPLSRGQLGKDVNAAQALAAASLAQLAAAGRKTAVRRAEEAS